MATTYSRMRTTLGEMIIRADWTAGELISALLKRDRDRNETQFRIKRGRLSRLTPISEDALKSLFNLMLQLQLIRQNANETYSLVNTTAATLDDEAQFQELITRRIMNYLQQHNASLRDIKSANESIHLPDIRDPKTILSRLKDDGKAMDINVEEFTRLLFLMACARKRATRSMKIFYDFG